MFVTRVLDQPAQRRLIARPSVQLLLTIATAVVVGSVALDSAAGTRKLLFLAVAGVVGAYFLARSPRWALFGFLVTTFSGFNLVSTSVGPINLRTSDAFYVPLVIWAMARKRDDRRTDVGQGPLVWLLLVLGLSLLPLGAQAVGDFFSALVPWARLVQTFTLIWLLPRVLHDRHDREFAVGAMMAAAAIALGRGILESLGSGILDVRLLAGGGPNTAGLLAGALLVLVLYAPVPRSPAARLALGSLAVVCLLLSRSVGSLAATGITIGVVGFGRTGNEPSARSLRPLRILLLGVGVVAIVGMLRQENLPSSAGFEGSTTQQRLILASAGVDVFLEHPFLGVGWQRSATPDVLGSEQLIKQLKSQFPDVRPDFFPTVGAQSTASVHNAYVQVLAEAGLAGGIALVFALLACGRRLRRLVKRLTGEDAQLARSMMITAALTLVWFNDNALFGAQPESTMLAVVLGVAASFPASSSGVAEESTAQPAVVAAEL